MATFAAEGGWYPLIRGPYVVYLRTSDLPYSRLRVDTQRQAIAALLSKGRAKLIGEFIEAEPLTGGARPELERAIALCEIHDATLVFGKLERMRGVARWFKGINRQHINIRSADLPQHNRFSLYRMIVNDWSERPSVSDNVIEALAAARERGVALGGKRSNSTGLQEGPAASAIARKQRAVSRGREIFEAIKFHQERGVTSLTAIATRLNKMGYRAPRGGEWSAGQVRRVIRMFES